MQKKLLRRAVGSDLYFQGKEYWCIDEKGNKVELANHGVIAILSITNKGKRNMGITTFGKGKDVQGINT